MEKGKWAALYGFVSRGSQRQKVLLALKVSKTVTQVAEQTQLSLSDASRSLRALLDKSLVRCLNPKDKIGRVYGLTNSGGKIRKKLIEAIGKK